jgi:Trk K+ transport system NAD-binding subunit
MLVAGIVRGRKAIIPGGMDEILAGDRVIVIVSGNQVIDLDDILE